MTQTTFLLVQTRFSSTFYLKKHLNLLLKSFAKSGSFRLAFYYSFSNIWNYRFEWITSFWNYLTALHLFYVIKLCWIMSYLIIYLLLFYFLALPERLIASYSFFPKRCIPTELFTGWCLNVTSTGSDMIQQRRWKTFWTFLS